jgi:Ca2+:H+ antiporter
VQRHRRAVAARRRAAPRVAEFNAEGTATALATVATLATLTLVLPDVHDEPPGPEFSPRSSRSRPSPRSRSTAVRARPDRAPPRLLPARRRRRRPEAHAAPPSARPRSTSLGCSLVALVAVVGLAKIESPAIEDASTRSARRRPPSAS